MSGALNLHLATLLLTSEKYSVLELTLSSCGGDMNKAAAQLAGCKEGKHHFCGN